MISAPQIDERPERLYMGIRAIAPFRSMFAEVDKLLKELRKWVNAHGIAEEGPFFLRYHVIDMDGPMDIEVGFVVAEHLPGDERVKPDTLPTGRYASLIYTGSGLKGNKALLNWAKDQGLALDRWNEPEGDAFRCRYEAYLTDYRIEHRKTKWEIELAIKLADSQ
jgi:effector-binding domain-containing protein